MLLFQKRFHAGLVDGAVRLTFRQWTRPQVKAGGRYRVHPIGVVEVDAVSEVALRDISEADAKASGFDSRAALLAFMAPVAKKKLTPATRVFRVDLHHAGDGDRVATAMNDQLTDAELDALHARLARFDAQAPWTRQVLTLIGKHPRTAASQLAKHLGQETKPFKARVVKLKKLGLTQSFEVGYELSPRGRRFLSLSA